MKNQINFRRYYDVFRDISTVVHAATHVDEVLELVVWKTTEVLGGKGASLCIINTLTNKSELFATYGVCEKYIYTNIARGHEVIKELCERKKVVIIQDIVKDPRVKDGQDLIAKGIRQIMDIPLVIREDNIGIIRIYFDDFIEMSEEELNFVSAVSETCACAIDKARLIEEQKSRYDHLALQTEKLSALGQMAAGIAHEINNPLAGILLFSTNMRKKIKQDGPIKEGLEVIIRETKRCKEIIQALLEFSRDTEPEKVKTSVNELIEKALNILSNEFHLHHISVKKDLSEDMPSLPMDVNLMQQVFVNLFINAIEAIQEHGILSVQSRMSDDQFKEIVDISDTGRGIETDQIPKIFDPFYSTKTNGTGLGLAVSYGIIRKHDGHIRVSSQPGKGTRFTIELPVSIGI